VSRVQRSGSLATFSVHRLKRLPTARADLTCRHSLLGFRSSRRQAGRSQLSVFNFQLFPFLVPLAKRLHASQLSTQPTRRMAAGLGSDVGGFACWLHSRVLLRLSLGVGRLLRPFVKILLERFPGVAFLITIFAHSHGK
jgi:hypothetical protein